MQKETKRSFPGSKLGCTAHLSAPLSDTYITAGAGELTEKRGGKINFLSSVLFAKRWRAKVALKYGPN